MKVIFAGMLALMMLQSGCAGQVAQKIKPGAPEVKSAEVAAGESVAQQAGTADPFLWNFGQVKEGDVVYHEFTFKNESPKALKITNVNTSCGCTGSEVAKKSLDPGESTSVKVKFNSAKYSGEVKQFVYLATDSIENPIYKYTIISDVIK